jgi:trimeric autotransporter adhesin
MSPSKFTSAQIIITDKNGKQLKQQHISSNGNGTLRVDASTLSSRTYNYSLAIDGKIISTKQMVLAK